jgi:multidrug efflux pump subunit AcrA (membrane-fusion protein)
MLIVGERSGFAASAIREADSERMQIPVGSPEEGMVSKVFVKPEQFLNEGDPIVELS